MEKKGRILIVDDNQSLVLAAQRVLQKEGFEVFTAFDGLQGLEKAQTEKPDLILLDIEMPKIDGYEVCRRLMNEPNTARIPVIFLSVKGDIDMSKGANVGLEEVNEAYKCGAHNFLTKPVTADELIAAVKDELRLSALLGEN